MLSVPVDTAAAIPTTHSNSKVADVRKARRGKCIGGYLSIDNSTCDPTFVQPGGKSRFERQCCSNCRAEGIACLAEYVRVLTQKQEPAFQTDKLRQSRMEYWHQSTGISQRFRLFNDKSRCTGAKVVVFESTPPEMVNGEALLPPVDQETGPGGTKVVRLWPSYGTLTLARSRKAFRRPPSDFASDPGAEGWGIAHVQQAVPLPTLWSWPNPNFG